jgi:hypothetical protein
VKFFWVMVELKEKRAKVIKTGKIGGKYAI